MTDYLFAVQDSTGRELVSAKVEDLKKVSEIDAVVEDGQVYLVRGEEKLQSGAAGDDSELFLHRWDAKDKHGTPVTRKVTR